MEKILDDARHCRLPSRMARFVILARDRRKKFVIAIRIINIKEIGRKGGDLGGHGPGLV